MSLVSVYFAPSLLIPPQSEPLSFPSQRISEIPNWSSVLLIFPTARSPHSSLSDISDTLEKQIRACYSSAYTTSVASHWSENKSIYLNPFIILI